MMFYVTLTHNETFGISFLKSTLEILSGMEVEQKRQAFEKIIECCEKQQCC